MLIKLTPKTPPAAPISYNANLGSSNTSFGILSTQLSGGLPDTFVAPRYLLPTWATFNTSTNRIVGEPYASPDESYFTNVVNVANKTELDAAIDAAADHDDIVATANALYDCSTPKTLKGLASGWYRIRSSALASLSARGTRVGPSDDTDMPLFRTDGSTTFYLPQGRVGVVFEGIKFACTQALTAGRLLFYASAQTQTTGAHVPTHIEWRRCRWLNDFGTAQSYCRRALWARCRYWKVIDCHFEGFTESGTDTQAIEISDTQGDFMIVNNFLEGGSENIMAGGVQTSIGSEANVSNFIIRNNYFFKRLSWLLGGAYASSCVRKNFIEWKVGNRGVIEGNFFENHDGTTQQGDLNFGAKPQNTGETAWLTVKDLLYRYNKFKNSAVPIAALSVPNDAGHGTTNGTARIEVCHNLWYAGWPSGSNGDNLLVNSSLGLDGLYIHNNTFQLTNMTMLFAPSPNRGGTGKCPNLEFSNNINYTATVFSAIGMDGDGANHIALDTFCGVGLWNVKNNIALNGWGPVLVNTTHNNRTATSLAQIGFTDLTNGNALLAAGSPYKGTGTDGKDPGVDQVQLDIFTNGVIGGTPTL